MEGWDGIEDLKAQYEQAGSWLSVMKSPGLCLDYSSRGGIVVLFHQFNASRWWLMLQYFVVLSRSWCQLMIKQEKNGRTRGPLSLIAAASLQSSLISSGCWKLPWHEFQPLLLCIILMFGPEGPVKRILSNVP